jgi:hypothetical protein
MRVDCVSVWIQSHGVGMFGNYNHVDRVEHGMSGVDSVSRYIARLRRFSCFAMVVDGLW